jgi:hypothetical protein
MPEETTRTETGANAPEESAAIASTAKGGNQLRAKSGFIHVIFHGLFCFFELDDHILVRVPFVPVMSMMDSSMDMSPSEKSGSPDTPAKYPCGKPGRFRGCASEHVYRAGSWLGELALNPGYYELKGVHPGYAHFDRSKNLVIQNGVPATNPANLYAEICIPYPLHIASVQQVNAPKSIFEGQVERLSSEYISLVQVLTYKFHNESKLELVGHRWRPASPRHPELDQLVSGFVALHLFAEPDHHVPNHVGHAFGTATPMFDGLKLTLVKPPATAPPIRISDIPFGTRIEEMLDMEQRTQIMAFLGLLRKRGENLNLAFDFASPDINASDPERCGGLIGG